MDEELKTSFLQPRHLRVELMRRRTPGKRGFRIGKGKEEKRQGRKREGIYLKARGDGGGRGRKELNLEVLDQHCRQGSACRNV